MTRLLVSVRSAQEAASALAGGAAVIDVKEPLRGSLGAADSRVWREVAAAVAGAVPLSAAMGELGQHEITDLGELFDFTYAKLGLAGCGKMPTWREQWSRQVERLPAGVAPVAVVYADWQEETNAPPPGDIIEFAEKLGCTALLVDTYNKHGPSLLEHISWDELRGLVDHARQVGMQVVLGGSLNAAAFPQLLPLQPDYLAVRRAACREGRSGTVDQELVARLAETLSHASTLRRT